jgi:hypothetical protein
MSWDLKARDMFLCRESRLRLVLVLDSSQILVLLLYIPFYILTSAFSLRLIPAHLSNLRIPKKPGQDDLNIDTNFVSIPSYPTYPHHLALSLPNHLLL